MHQFHVRQFPGPVANDAGLDIALLGHLLGTGSAEDGAVILHVRARQGTVVTGGAYRCSRRVLPVLRLVGQFRREVRTVRRHGRG